MAKPKLLETDENSLGEVIFFTTTGEFYARKSDILIFIETEIQPTRTEGVGLVSDPHEREEDVCVDPTEYYDEHHEYVDNRYFEEVLCQS